MTLDLTVATGEMDLTNELGDTVQPQGIDVTLLNYPSPVRHWRMIKHQEFDVAELSMGSYLTSVQYEDEFPFTAIPVFPNRRFRHSYMFKNTEKDISDPGDFAGKKIGVKSWNNSGGIWMKGIAQEHYGLDITDVEWFSDASMDVPTDIPDELDVTIKDDASVEQELIDGNLDGAMYPLLLSSVKSQNPNVTRVFENYQEVEEQYYEKTGIFPPNHIVAIRDELLEKHPWVATNMQDAFEEALEICMRKMEDPRWTALAWASEHLEHQKEVLGSNPWEYGFTEENIKAIETVQRYAYDQGIIPKIYDLDELFVETTLGQEERELRERIGNQIYGTKE